MPEQAQYTGPERIDLFDPLHDDIVKHWHAQRYAVTVPFLIPGMILDAGCGVGYGTQLLAQSRPEQQVIGVDVSQDAITIAQSRYDDPNLAFLVDDLETYEPPCEPRNVIMFEVIEHLSDPERGLRNIARFMLPEARLWISIPLGEYLGQNPYHKTLWEVDDFVRFVTDVGFVKRKTELKQPLNWTGLFVRS